MDKLQYRIAYEIRTGIWRQRVVSSHPVSIFNVYSSGPRSLGCLES